MTIQQKKRVAVIGAGASGLAAIKECLDERDNIEVVAFEQESFIGGLWRYVEISDENPNPHSSVYKSTIINTSKEIMTFSDFPIPDDWPTYLPNQMVARYFEMYAERFGLKEHIRFQTKVIEIRELKDTGSRWMIRFQKTHTPKLAQEEPAQEEVFDYVMVCTGHHWDPRYPSFPGMDVKNDPEAFTGEQLHSHFYRQADQYRDKIVVVVGFGNSAVDLAVELSMNYSTVYLSSRRPSWVLPRWFMGKPLDHGRTRFSYNIPPRIVQYITTQRLQRILPPVHKNMRPSQKLFEAYPTVNSILPERISTGTIHPMKNIRRLGPGKRVEFEDGSVIENVDSIIYCTGFNVRYPALTPEVLTDGRPGAEERNQAWVWNYMVPPRHPNLAFVGLVQPLGAIMPISEIQSRFLIRILVGKAASLPSAQQMDLEIQETRDRIQRQYYDSPRHTIQVESTPYCDQLAVRIGCYPGWAALVSKYGFWEGTRLWKGSMFGPSTPLQYRLVGPNSSSTALDAVRGHSKPKQD
ncbi:hypothetical protein BGW38_004100 [Lunasporangiospora selenospora]|uniref:Flavin-containing monooxygenase 1 n=1 Tax=Lunasporangiospora selenospora TaxID=979761 RepID=A0A9P6FPR8_9FUNG|nr:hypothetical protein BGW38_004100 [Lunasporangiospora selenospora]